MTDPAFRHGGPGAGWYLRTMLGWRRVSDTEAANERYEDMRHFMHDPRTVTDMATVNGGNGAPEMVAPDGRTILGGGGAGESTMLSGTSAAGGGVIPPGSLRLGDRVQVYANGVLRCTHATITDGTDEAEA